MKTVVTSIKYPFAVDSGLGKLAEENNYSNYIEQLIRQVLLTNQGERVNRADFGCGLRQMVFAPNSEVTANLTQIVIYNALEKWLGTVISINDVKVKAIQEVLEVRMVYTLKERQERCYLNLEVKL